MRKLDFLIYGIVLLFGLLLFILFNTNNTKEYNTIQLIVNNQIIDETHMYNENTYLIVSDNTNIYIYKNNNLITKINNDLNKNIYNNVIIKDNKVIMSEANCKGKDCLHMEISQEKKLPIICTNGVVIKLIENNNSDIIV